MAGEQSQSLKLTFRPVWSIIIDRCGCDAAVAYLLPKQAVVGSNPITRFFLSRERAMRRTIVHGYQYSP